MKKKNILYALTLFALLSSCAGKYSEIMPSNISYESNLDTEALNYSYRYDLMTLKGNKKYVSKESKSGVKLVALKITNKTNRPLVFGKDIKLYRDQAPISILKTDLIYKSMKQNPLVYLLYLLLSFVRLDVSDGVKTTHYPIGLFIGPVISLGNMGGASSANKKFLQELVAENLLGRSIEPGQTVSGLIGVSLPSYDILTLKVVN